MVEDLKKLKFILFTGRVEHYESTCIEKLIVWTKKLNFKLKLLAISLFSLLLQFSALKKNRYEEKMFKITFFMIENGVKMRAKFKNCSTRPKFSALTIVEK